MSFWAWFFVWVTIGAVIWWSDIKINIIWQRRALKYTKPAVHSGDYFLLLIFAFLWPCVMWISLYWHVRNFRELKAPTRHPVRDTLSRVLFGVPFEKS